MIGCYRATWFAIMSLRRINKWNNMTLTLDFEKNGTQVLKLFQTFVLKSASCIFVSNKGSKGCKSLSVIVQVSWEPDSVSVSLWLDPWLLVWLPLNNWICHIIHWPFSTSKATTHTLKTSKFFRSYTYPQLNFNLPTPSYLSFQELLKWQLFCQ